MANVRAQKSGFAREAQDKINAKYDEKLAGECMAWINQRVQSIGDPAVNTSGSMDNVYEMLGDGSVLCRLMESLGCTLKWKKSGLAFKKMENIGKFLTAAESYGVSTAELFQTVDLYEKQNLNQVICAIGALGRKANSKGGSGFGPKESERQSREWTDEQLKAGQNVIGLQMGSNKGASQAGQSFGKQRMINDL